MENKQTYVLMSGWARSGAALTGAMINTHSDASFSVDVLKCFNFCYKRYPKLNQDWDSVIPVRKAKEFPQWMIDWDGANIGKTLLGNDFDGEYNVSKKLKKYYYPMGAFFINRVSSFMKEPSMYGNNWGCYELDGDTQIDIDEPEDWLEAEKIFKTFFS